MGVWVLIFDGETNKDFRKSGFGINSNKDLPII